MKEIKLLKSATIIDPSSSFHLQSQDILITDGIITQIASSIKEESQYEIISHENLHVSPGWIDMKCNLREPGEEWKETLESGVRAANAGGFTHLVTSPSTKQPIDSANRVLYVLNKACNLPITVSPLGTLSDNHKGEELSEMYEMSQAGAVAFTDDKQGVNTGLMSKGLLYAKNLNKLIISFANDDTLSNNGQIHEGTISTKTGMKGIPSLSEEMIVSRDLALADYHDCPIHFTCISSSNSVELIREAKKKGIQVTCDIAAHQLYFTDKSSEDFDSNFKVLPPFREQTDIDGLIAGLKDGTIDAICTDHSPHDIESKKLEFNLADFGILGLETAFASLHSVLNKSMKLEEILAKITSEPRAILGLETPVIQEGKKADITLFDPNKTWTFETENIQSKSKNTPFVGTQFIGKVLGTIC